jgi:Mn-dependent DtxR family transcriptional regulator
MPPLPRRSVRESELLTAAREVERWRGQPSATRISRELGIGMPLASSLANALREEEGPGE